MSKASVLFLGLILLLGGSAVLAHVVAADEISVTLTASGNIEVQAGASGHTSLTFGGIAPVGSITNVLIACSGLPAGASFSLSPYPNPLPGPVSDGNSFILTVTTSLATLPGNYPITCQAASFTEPTIIAPSFAVSPISLSNGGGSLGPDSISIQQLLPPTFHLIVDPAPAIPEYPLGIPVLAIFMILTYGLIKRRTRNPEDI